MLLKILGGPIVVAALLVQWACPPPTPHTNYMTWRASVTPNVTYRLYRAQVHGGPYALIGTGIANLYYADAQVQSGVTYFYVATAVNANGESVYSNEAMVRAK